MFPGPNRRDFLGLLVGAAGLWPAAPALGEQRPPTPTPPRSPIATTQLGDNLFAFTGAGSNVVVVTAPDGLVMINGGLKEHSDALLEAVAARTDGRRVQTLFNTDWRPERTGSNETLGKRGAKIVAHENTKQYLAADLFVDWEKRRYNALPVQALPTQTFYTTGSMSVGADRIEYGHLGQAHTDSAIYVFLRGPNVLIAGGALGVGRYPIPDYTTGGWLGGLIAANKTLLSLANAETRVIPGAGPVQSRADVQAQHDMLAAMMDRFVKMMKQGMGPDDIIAAGTTKEFDATWGNADLFVTTAYRSMWLHVRELGGIV